MKKLMIMAAIASAAVAAQAEAYWKIQSAEEDGVLYNGNGDSIALGNSTICIYSIGWDVSKEGWLPVAREIVTGFLDTSKTKESIISDSVATLTTDSSGKIALSSFKVDDIDADLETGFFAVAFNGDGIYVSSYVGASGGEDLASAPLMDITFTSSDEIMDESTFFNRPGWYGTVPEPTSGVLMLLGLALKRKRA